MAKILGIFSIFYCFISVLLGAITDNSSIAPISWFLVIVFVFVIWFQLAIINQECAFYPPFDLTTLKFSDSFFMVLCYLLAIINQEYAYYPPFVQSVKFRLYRHSQITFNHAQFMLSLSTIV
jgi:hypothetical protein